MRNTNLTKKYSPSKSQFKPRLETSTSISLCTQFCLSIDDCDNLRRRWIANFEALVKAKVQKNAVSDEYSKSVGAEDLGSSLTQASSNIHPLKFR